MVLPLAGAKILADDLLGVFPQNTDGWDAYVPVWAATGVQPAIGNGSITGAYMKVGRLVVYRLQMTTGSTSTYGTGAYTWTLPTAPAAISHPFGQATLIDNSAGARFNRYLISNGGLVVLAQTEGAVAAAATVPFTWATGDSINISGMYEATT